MNAPLEQLAEIDQKNREIADDLSVAKSYTAHVRHQIANVTDIWHPTIQYI
jgi:hypothetical protein